MRRIVAQAAALGLGLGCAQMGAPPGGPPRLVPPALTRVIPDSAAINVRTRGVMFEFDAVVNDRDVARYFLLSPREGEPRVFWRRNRVEVRPRRGFRPNVAYSVTLLPGLADLQGNRMETGRTVVFSTGPTIPPYVVSGRVFDWMNNRIAPGSLIEVIRRPDSLPYLGAADSTGQFTVGPLDEGTYTVRATLDNNRNGETDVGEPWDSLSIAVRGTSPFVELLAAPRDSFAPRLQTVAAPDSLRIVATFDRPVNPEPPVTAATFRIVRADSTPLRIVRVLTRAQADSIDAAARAARDTTTRRDTTPAPPLTVQEPRPSRPPPPRDFVIQVDSATPLQPGTAYRVTAIDIRGLLGPTRTSERVFTHAAARRDSVALPPGRPPARPPTTRPPGAEP